MRSPTLHIIINIQKCFLHTAEQDFLCLQLSFFFLQGHWRGSLKVQALKTKGGQGQKTSSESLISIASIYKLLRNVLSLK